MVGYVSKWLFNGSWQVHLFKTGYFEGKTHDEDDARAASNVGCVDFLQGYGFLKLFHTPSMVSHA